MNTVSLPGPGSVCVCVCVCVWVRTSSVSTSGGSQIIAGCCKAWDVFLLSGPTYMHVAHVKGPQKVEDGAHSKHPCQQESYGVSLVLEKLLEWQGHACPDPRWFVAAVPLFQRVYCTCFFGTPDGWLFGRLVCCLQPAAPSIYW